MILTVLREFIAYCIAPRLIAPEPLARDRGWTRWGVMLGAYLAGLAVLALALGLWQHAAHVPGPTAFSGHSARGLALVVLLLAPVGEEVLFRGWLTGRPRALWLVAVALIGCALMAAVMLHWHDMVAGVAVVACVPLALAGWWRLRHRTETPAAFARCFGPVFVLSALVFGLLHLTNYPALGWAFVPMVLPQIWAGFVFGYLRMRHGLGASILAHVCGNAVALATALIAGH
jgi:membrane protease YdiL (CAAX protease family)